MKTSSLGVIDSFFNETLKDAEKWQALGHVQLFWQCHLHPTLQISAPQPFLSEESDQWKSTKMVSLYFSIKKVTFKA